MDQTDKPTPPDESASGTPNEEQGGKPKVSDLLAAARGDVVRREGEGVRREPAPRKERTVVPPSAKIASAGTAAEAAPPGDDGAKEVPAATPAAARATPASGASKTISTPSKPCRSRSRFSIEGSDSSRSASIVFSGTIVVAMAYGDDGTPGAVGKEAFARSAATSLPLSA